MNFEHLCKLVAFNIDKLKNKKKTKFYLKYQYEILTIKKNKLKLGAVAFDIVNTTYANFIFNQTIEIRYIRQDTTQEDELKIENRLKALNWKWNYSNVLALLIILIFLFILIYSVCYVWYCNNLYEFAYQNPKYDLLVKNSFYLTFVWSIPESFTYLKFINFLFIDGFISFCSFFNIFF